MVPEDTNQAVEPLHDLSSFMQKVSTEMAADYTRIRRRAREDAGTAGDQGEENWAALLREWLPHTYHVRTKGRLLSAGGRASPQVDVVVLSPSYPPSLLDEKYYFAGGVIAAIECKTTLRAEHISSAVKRGAEIARLAPDGTGSPYRELHAPIIRALVAHSHDWQQPNSTPVGNVTSTLERSDEEYVRHPREMLDVVCVADTGTWIGQRTSWIGPNARPDDNVWMALDGEWVPLKDLAWSQLEGRYGENGSASTSYVGFPTGEEQDAGFTPIGTFITHLLRQIAWNDRQLRAVVSYFVATKTLGRGTGTNRRWDETVFSEGIREAVMNGVRSAGTSWNEWRTIF